MESETVVINYRLDLKKWAKQIIKEDGVYQLVYEFIKDGKILNVEFKTDYAESGLDNYGNPDFDDLNEPIEVVIKCNNLKALNLWVDSIFANNIQANNLQISYGITANNIKAVAVGAGGIYTNNIEAEMLESLVVKAKKVTATYMDLLDIENVKSLRCNVLLSPNKPNENQEAKYYIETDIRNKKDDLFKVHLMENKY
jgi:hypothetical protein